MRYSGVRRRVRTLATVCVTVNISYVSRNRMVKFQSIFDTIHRSDFSIQHLTVIDSAVFNHASIESVYKSVILSRNDLYQRSSLQSWPIFNTCLKAQKSRGVTFRLFLCFYYFFVKQRFFFHFRQHLYIHWVEMGEKKHVRLIYIPSAEILSFIKICGLWFVNISYSIYHRVVSTIGAYFSSNILFTNSSLHTINDVAMSRTAVSGLSIPMRTSSASFLDCIASGFVSRDATAFGYATGDSAPVSAVTIPVKGSTTLDWSFDNAIGTPAVSRPSASVARESIRFDIGVTAGAASADISSLLSSERRRFQLASLNIEQTVKPSHPRFAVARRPRIFALVITHHICQRFPSRPVVK